VSDSGEGRWTIKAAIDEISTAGLKILRTMAVYAGTKNAVRTVTEALRQEAGPNLRVTGVSPGMVRTNFVKSITSEKIKEQIRTNMSDIGLPPEAVARAIAFAIEQPPDVEIGDIVIRPRLRSLGRDTSEPRWNCYCGRFLPR
jgi:NADP-dependent 3-hydroxy acid dehydrogenase YdfG